LEDRTVPANPLPPEIALSPYNFAPASTVFDPVGFGGPGGGPIGGPLGPLGPTDDPGALGPLAVTAQGYDFGSAAFVPAQFGTPTSTNKVELTGEIYAPTNLSTSGPLPLVVLMHGNHFDEFSGTTPGFQWPIPAPFQPIPNYLGYGYFANVLASHGYVVVSISTNGVNVLGGGFPGTGMVARGQLIERTLDMMNDLNTDGVVHTRAGDTTNFVDGQTPFGTRFVGKINMQDVGLMGHSRGGEGAVQGFLVNQSRGSPYGIKAVFALAPVDFQAETINNVPFAVLLPYNDGDVSDLQGAHFFDDSRYNVSGDTGPKFSIEVMGACHNFYNTIWSPGGFQAGASDDGNPGPPSRLTQDQERGTGLAYMSAFFRTYVGGETQFLPILTGDAAPPPSAQVTPDRIHIGYLPADDTADRRDVNRLLTPGNLTTNTLGGAVVTGGLSTYTIGGPIPGEVDRGNQLSLSYSGGLTAFYENDLPPAARDVSNYNDLQFRIGVNFADTAHNPANTAQDFSVTLVDGSGHSHSVLVSAFSNSLFDPPTPAGNPHEVLNTVRIPLSAYVGSLDLSNVTAVRFNFDQHTSGAFQIADIDFADVTSAAGPFVVSSTPSGDVFGQFSSVRVQFDRPIDVSTFTLGQVGSFTRTVGTNVTDLSSTLTGVTAVAGSGGRAFTVNFTTQSTLGVYSMVIGPNILDLAGHAMDQDHNGIPGESPGDQFTAQFALQGPQIIDATPSDNASLPNTVDHVRITFNEAINPGTLNLSDVFARGPNGSVVNITGITAVTGSGNKQFDIKFATLTQSGQYSVFVLPFVTDAFGNALDEDGNFIGGELPDDIFVDQFGVTGPQGVSAAANSVFAGEVTRLRVTFNEDMDLSSFTPSKIASFTDPNGNDILGSVRAVVPVSPTNFRQFDVFFTPQTTAGTYTMVIGPNIRDVYGNVMDQDVDAVLPAGTDDQFTATFNVNGPLVVSSSPTGNQNPGVDHAQVNFNSAIDPASLRADTVSFTGPAGAISLTDIAPVPFTNNTQFVFTFDSQVAAGNYALTLSTGVTDAYGNPLSAPFTDAFTITSPTVTSASPSGSLVGPVDHVHLTFSRAIDATTFGPDQVAFINPRGASITITSVTETGGNPTQFDINFAPQGIAGNFTLTLGSGITDVFGNPLAAQLPSELVVNGGFENPLGSEWTIVDPTRSTFRDDGTFAPGVPPHTGSWFLALGEAGADATITQTVPTVPGETYTFSFWYWSSGQGPNDLHALWNGTEVYSEVNPPAHGYQLHTFTETATGSTTTIQFKARNDPVFDALDDVSVIATRAIAFVERFTITSPTVTGTTPGAGTLAAPFNDVVVTFDRPMEATTLTGAITLTGPGGAIPVTVTAVSGQGNRQFDVSFAAQGAAGNYTLAISTAAHDTFANPLASAFSRVFTITSPTVTGTTPGAGTVAAPFNDVVVTFDRPMNATTVTGAITLNGPSGAIPVTVTAVAGQGNRQFDVSFAAQSAAGNYTMAISTAAHDTFANPLASAFSRVFTIPGASSNLVTNGGFETGDFTGWTRSGDSSFTSVISGTPDGTTIHSGTHALQTGPGTSLGFFAQTLATTAGASYTLSFWLSHPSTGTGTEWLVRVGGNTLMDVHDAGNFGYTQFTFTFTATSTSTVLQFGFLEPPSYFYLDDVSVTRNP
jgi:methionine-rich copper-binding protein CopC